jgi:hypothetical protein
MNSALQYAARIAYSSEAVLEFTFDQAVKYKDSPGIYVETGCAAGAQVIALAAGGGTKPVIAFDSFVGLPLPSNKDDQMPGLAFLTKAEQMALPDPGKQALITTGAVVVSEENFWEHLDNAFGETQYHVTAIKGWFEETIPKWAYDNPGAQIAILRLDGDLYNSTYVALKYLYPKVIKGGVCIIDDYALPGCRAAVVDYFNNLDPGMKFITDKNSTVAWWTK